MARKVAFCMDLFKAIQELLDEKQKLTDLITYLEAIRGPKPGAQFVPLRLRNRRGRKSMAPAERAEVSRRMKAYWDKRRKENASQTENGRASAASV